MSNAENKLKYFLDYIFLCSLVFVGFMISPPGLEAWYFGLLVITGAFMVNSFLLFAATNTFGIYRYGLGPTEFRMCLIAINTFIILFGTSAFHIILPVTVLLCGTALIVNACQIHRRLWALDMKSRRE